MEKRFHNLQKKVSIFLFFLLLFPILLKGQSQNEMFIKLVGQQALMDAKITVEYLLAQPQQRVYLDTNNDNKVDTIYMIDTHERHGSNKQPLLVKIVDEDNDMDITNKGDYDSDLYIADWYGDNAIDRVIDYHDLDNDDDVDEQYLYGFRNQQYYVAWAKDYGDDNRLWYDINYEYYQLTTQWQTDFNGEEMFVYWFRYDEVDNSLTPCEENAFSFYDLDKDTYSEVAVRFEGTGLTTKNLRYSMDIDNDNELNEPYHHDYDFSVSSLGPVEIPSGMSRNLIIRGIKTEPIVKWEDMRALAKTGAWIKNHLTWDENDNNITILPGRQRYERWEGVLNHPNEYMPQIGGPSCGSYNKRNETDLDASGKMQFYYSPVDYRLHLFGAEIGFIKVDYDYNETVDMYLIYEDKNKNGYFDTWKYDVDGDSIWEMVYRIDNDSTDLIPFDYDKIQNKFLSSLNNNIEQNNTIIKSLQNAISIIRGREYEDPVDSYFDSEILSYDPEYHLGEKIKNSKEGQRYYGDLLRTRLWHIFRNSAGFFDISFQLMEDKYIKGEYIETAQMIDASMNKLFPIHSKLIQNYPNPFNEATTIFYYLSQYAHTRIKIYSILGREVETLINKSQNAGLHVIKWKPGEHSSGTYLCSMEIGNNCFLIKMLLIK